MLGKFACGRYQFVLQAESPLRLSAFAGSTLRGGFGHGAHGSATAAARIRTAR